MNTAAPPAPRHRPSNHRLEFLPATEPGGLACWLVLPDRPDASRPALVAVHGIRRGAEEQATRFAQRAAEMGRVVIAPLFDLQHWPRYQRLGDGAAAALLGLLDGLAGRQPAPLARFDLFGFSGGAQFAHRFAMLHPERLNRLVLASAGWYTFPDTAPYPYGLGTQPAGSSTRAARMQARLDEFLRLPIDVCVGERDNRRDPNTRTGNGIDRQQGRDRRARASRWTEAIAIEAAVRGIRSQVRFSVLPGCGHDFRRCVRRGGLLDQVFREPLDTTRWPVSQAHMAGPHWPPAARTGPALAAWQVQGS